MKRGLTPAGYPAVMYAVLERNRDLNELVLKSGANVMKFSLKGDTPTLYGVERTMGKGVTQRLRNGWFLPRGDPGEREHYHRKIVVR